MESRTRASSATLAELVEEASAAAAASDGSLHPRLAKRAADIFAASGLPGTGEEDWRYTDLDFLTGERFGAVPGVEETEPVEELIRGLVFEALDCHTLVFVNGGFRRELSRIDELPEGVAAGSLAELVPTERENGHDRDAGSSGHPLLAEYGGLAPLEGWPFAALNTALARDGCGLWIPDGVRLKRPLMLLSITAPGAESLAVQQRILVHAGRESSATLLECHGGTERSPCFCNALSEFHVGEGAAFEHIRLQRDGRRATRVSNLFARIERKAGFRTHTLTFGGATARNQAEVRLEGPGAHAEVNGLTILDGEQHVDTHTAIEHLAPDCSSRQIFRGILDDRAQGVFTGRIRVHRDAQRTDAEQSSRSLLLSERARSWSRPQLEIYADDVKCTHGSTVGSLQDEALFYLRSRGIELSHARRLLIHAFASDLVGRIRTVELISHLDRLLTGHLAR